MWSAIAVVVLALAVHENVAMTDEEKCSLKIDPGKECAERKAGVRYGYVAKNGKCEMFLYKGCGGNYNKFYDKTTCEKRCKEKIATTTSTTTASQKSWPKCRSFSDLKEAVAQQLDKAIVKKAIGEILSCKERNFLINSIEKEISKAIHLALAKESIRRRIKIEPKKGIREDLELFVASNKPKPKGWKFSNQTPLRKLPKVFVDFRKTNRIPIKSKSIEEMEKNVNKKVTSKEVKKAFTEAKTEQSKKALKKAIEKEVGEAVKKVVVKEKIKRIISTDVSPEKKPELQKILSKLEKIEIESTVLHPVKDTKTAKSAKGRKLFLNGDMKHATTKSIVEEVKKNVNEKVASKEVRKAFAEAKSEKEKKILGKTLEKEVAKAIKKAIVKEKLKITKKVELNEKIGLENSSEEKRQLKLPLFDPEVRTKKIALGNDVKIKVITATAKIIIDHDLKRGLELGESAKDKSNPCRVPIKTGMCKAAHKRYGYDAKLGKCVSFIFGGCGGNENNFKTMLECKKACEVIAPLDIKV